MQIWMVEPLETQVMDIFMRYHDPFDGTFLLVRYLEVSTRLLKYNLKAGLLYATFLLHVQTSKLIYVASFHKRLKEDSFENLLTHNQSRLAGLFF